MSRRDVLGSSLLGLHCEGLPEGALLGVFLGALLDRQALSCFLLSGSPHGLDVDLGLRKLLAQLLELRGERRVFLRRFRGRHKGPGVELLMVPERALKP
jgi:hypothetical protein